MPRANARPPLPNPAPGVLARAQAGEESAFEELFRMYWPVFVRLAWGFFAPDRAAVEDAAMESIEDLQRHLARFEGRRGSKFSTWAYGVALKRMLMVCRSMRRRPRTVAAGGAVRFATAEDARARAARLEERATLEGKEDEEALAGFMELAWYISRLPDREAQAMSLVRLCGMDEQAAARCLGIGYAALRKRLSRGEKEAEMLRRSQKSDAGTQNAEAQGKRGEHDG